MSTRAGKRGSGPIPTPVAEEDVVEPRQVGWARKLKNLLFSRLGLYLLIFLLFLALLFALAKGAGAAFRWFERQQSTRLTQRGTAYLAEGQRDAARMSAETALHLTPDNPDALRLLAKIHEADGRSEDLFEIYQRLGNTGYATMAEFKQLATAAAHKGYLTISHWLANWVSQQGEADFPHLLQAEVSESEGRIDAARAELENALALTKSNRSRRELARFLLAHSEHGSENARIHALLAELSRSEDAEGHEALVIGLLSGVVPPEDRLSWITSLRKHPQATAQSLLIADAIEIETSPDQRPAIVENLVRRVQGKSLDDRLLAVRWLIRQGEPMRVDAILPEQEALQRQDAFALWIESRAALGRWEEVLAAVKQSPSLLPQESSPFIIGQALKKTGLIDEGRAHYLEALQKIENTPDPLLPALAFLYSDGEDALFRQYATPLLANEKTALTALSQLSGAIRQRGDSQALRDFLQLAIDAGPLSDYPDLHNEIAYHDLILARSTDHAAIVRRAEAHPDNLAFQFTRALSEWKQGFKAKALTTAETMDFRPRDLPPEHQLILACLLAANGQLSEAQKVATLLNVAPLTVQERLLLRNSVENPKRISAGKEENQ